jgi:hypothetical protein
MELTNSFSVGISAFPAAAMVISRATISNADALIIASPAIEVVPMPCRIGTHYPGFPIQHCIYLLSYAAEPLFQKNIKLIVKTQAFYLLKKTR